MPDPSARHRFTDRVAVVTGAASGIGRATALLLASEGAAVAALDRNESGAAETATRIGCRLLGGSWCGDRLIRSDNSTT